MDKNQKLGLKESVLLGTGLFTEYALLQSMTRSKTLTIMVFFGLTSFAGLLFYLFNYA
jgi:hypothetical protein